MRVDLRVKHDIEARRAAIGHFERGHGPKSCERTREQELEERCRRLETEVAYLKKLRALVGRDGLWGPGPSPLTDCREKLSWKCAGISPATALVFSELQIELNAQPLVAVF